MALFTWYDARWTSSYSPSNECRLILTRVMGAKQLTTRLQSWSHWITWMLCITMIHSSKKTTSASWWTTVKRATYRRESRTQSQVTKSSSSPKSWTGSFNSASVSSTSTTRRCCTEIWRPRTYSSRRKTGSRLETSAFLRYSRIQYNLQELRSVHHTTCHQKSALVRSMTTRVTCGCSAASYTSYVLSSVRSRENPCSRSSTE